MNRRDPKDTSMEFDDAYRNVKDLFGKEAENIWEGMGPEHRHGDGPIERHAVAELVSRRED